MGVSQGGNTAADTYAVVAVCLQFNISVNIYRNLTEGIVIAAADTATVITVGVNVEIAVAGYKKL